MHDNFPSMQFFFREWNWKDDSAHLEIFSQVLGFGACNNVEPFLGLAGIFEELWKFWILELAAVLSPFLFLQIFEKLWFDLAAMFEFKLSLRIFH
ncbi:hypothetical protein AAC387_Pa07g2051 [Persea americana]